MLGSEVAELMAFIAAHHGNARVSEFRRGVFASELLPDMTLAEGLEAVRRFYASAPHGSWCEVGDVNRGVRALRRAGLPSEARVEAEVSARGLTGLDAWRFRRAVMSGVVRLPDAGSNALPSPQDAPERRLRGA